MQIYWVGLSSQRTKVGEQVEPLSENTPTGQIVESIINECPSGTSHKKINFVDQILTDTQGRLRPPTTAELDQAWDNMHALMKKESSNMFVFFGEPIRKFIQSLVPDETIEKYANYELFNTNALFAHHPSYIRVYKYKEISDYSSKILNVIESALH